MRVAVATLTLLILAGCGGASSHRLAGEWVMMDGVLQHPLACGAHGPITYRADGTYSQWGESGTWRSDGEKLTEIMTDFDPLHTGQSTTDFGKPFVSTLTWTSHDRFLKKYADGSTREFLRCPKSE